MTRKPFDYDVLYLVFVYALDETIPFTLADATRFVYFSQNVFLVYGHKG